MDFLYNTFFKTSQQTSSNSVKANASDDVSACKDSSCVDSSESISNRCVVPEFFGAGQKYRPKFSPISLNAVRRIKYIGINHGGFHLFKVWYVEMPDKVFDVRDYEEVVETYPYILDTCIREIRLGFREYSKPVRVLGAQWKPSVVEDDGKKVVKPEWVNRFVNKTKFCVLHSFLNTMKMEEDVRDYMITNLRNERTDLKEMASFLYEEGIVLKKEGVGNKMSWLLSVAEPGKYLVAGNCHVVGFVVDVDQSVKIIDSAERHEMVGSKRNLQSCIGSDVDEIRLIVDIRKKKAKRFNKLNKMLV